MGKIFLEHMGGQKLYNCASCNANLSNHDELIRIICETGNGRGYLFGKVVNVTFGKFENRGESRFRHQVREVFCKNCTIKLGWVYEYVKDESLRSKEGKTLLQASLIVSEKGLDFEI